jgi:hypothetical protein
VFLSVLKLFFWISESGQNTEAAMRFLLRAVGLALVSGFLLLAAQDRAFGQAFQATAPAALEVIANNGAGVEKHLLSHGGFVGQLVIRPNQAVPVTLQFASDKIGSPLAVVPMDGGEINHGDLAVSPTGMALFTFRAQSPGLYRVMVQLSSEQHRIEFFVLDPNRPRPSTGMAH